MWKRWSGLEDENPAVGSEGDGEKKEVRREVYMRTGVKKLLRTGLVLARACEGQAVGIAPTERLKLRSWQQPQERRSRFRCHFSCK